MESHTIAQHFTGRAPSVRAIYDRIVSAAQTFGPVREEPKKTSIHLARRTAFAGVATRKTALEVKLETPQQVDRELKAWLKKAFALAQ
jgi:hypothetical protein